MSARTAGAVVLTFAALGLAGCGEDSTAAWADPKSPASASPSGAGSASSPSVDRAALQEKSKAATVAPKGFAGIGISASPKEDKPVTYNLTLACGKQTDADRNSVRASYNRTWSATGWWVSNTAHAYGTATGADAVKQAQAAVESCKTYTGSDGEHTMLGPVKLPQYQGVEAGYGYCQRIKRTDATYVSCLAFLAKGNLVSSVWVVHGQTQQTNSTGLTTVAAVAADALRKVA
jgi:hypothetical protein